MPGKKITEQQVKLYMQSRKNGKNQKISAAQTGFSERTARNIEKRGFEAAKTPRDWRTRKDPFEKVWELEIVPLLEKSPHLQGRTLLEKLQQDHPEDYSDELLRTLQRRIRKWRAISGPEREIIFRQEHPPGWQGMSDFTHGKTLNITILGSPFEHLLYHYRLVYSMWEDVTVILGGESFTALSEGLQSALWMSNGVPETHRTDSLSAAYKNFSDKEKEEFTDDYSSLCAYYKTEPTRNNKGVAHENGAIESSHGDLKNRIDQSLMLRGSRDFSSIEEYRHFVREVVARHNRRIHKKYLEELMHLRALPERKTLAFKEVRARVTSSSTIRVSEVIYSVQSRLISMILKVHLYDDRLECFIGSELVSTIERKRRKGSCQVHQINYRHVVGSLVHKPQAFRRYVYREELFPTLAFRETWKRLDQELDSKTACKEYIKILKEASEGSNETIVNEFLEKRLLNNILPSAKDVQSLFRTTGELPQLTPLQNDLNSYDILIGGF